MAVRGRKILLTEDLCDKICEYIAMGNYIDDCCQAVGISRGTYYNWRKLGKKGEEPYATFLKRVKEAEAKSIVTHVGIIHDTAETGNWLASAWLLERKHPNKFGKREQMALQSDNNFELKISSAKSPYELGEEEKRLLEEDQKDE